MKYVMLETANGEKLPFLFPEKLVHARVARITQLLIDRDMGQLAKPVSAGFVNVGTLTATFGESETLDLKSLPSDAAYMVLGGAVSHMPDTVVLQMLEKMKGNNPW